MKETYPSDQWVFRFIGGAFMISLLMPDTGYYSMVCVIIGGLMIAFLLYLLDIKYKQN